MDARLEHQRRAMRSCRSGDSFPTPGMRVGGAGLVLSSSSTAPPPLSRETHCRGTSSLRPTVRIGRRASGSVARLAMALRGEHDHQHKP
jgi:hypothetical protein